MKIEETDMYELTQAIRDALDVDLPDIGIRHVVVLGEVATGRTTVAERIAAALPDATRIQVLACQDEMRSLSQTCGRLTVVPMNSAPPAGLVRDAMSRDLPVLVVGDTSDENAPTVLDAMGIGLDAPYDDDLPHPAVIACHRGSAHARRPDGFMDRIRTRGRGTIAVVSTVMDRETRLRSIASVEIF